MANSFQDLSNILANMKDTFPPQTLTVTGAGDAILAEDVGTNRINARLSVGDVNTLTSLNVKMQASTDNSNWDDISGAVFTEVTAADPDPETIVFQLPASATATSPPYIYVRAYATLVGTSVDFAVSLLGNRRYNEDKTGYLNAPPTIN